MRKFRTLAALMTVAGLTATLAGCAHGPDTGAERWPGSQPNRPAPEAPEVETPDYQPPAPPPVQQSPAAPAYRPIAGDQCGASALQYLIGKPRTDIPVPLQPSMRRVVCSTCVATQDYRATRQTIIFDTDTGLIKSVGCG